MHIRPLTTVDEFRQVFALENAIWGYTSAEDPVPVPMMGVSVTIGGLLLGAFEDEGEGEGAGSPGAPLSGGAPAPGGPLAGFVYSLPGLRHGTLLQWSHMLGVVERHRNTGLGWRLKVEQRRLVMAAGIDLIEWTYDPLQVLNAHLNFVKLGAVATEYHENVYGDSSSALHRGTPTDRLIAAWWLRSRRVEQRLEAVRRGQARPADAGDAVTVNRVRECGTSIAPLEPDLALDAPTLGVTIPGGFTEMQQADLPLAQAWRRHTRAILTTYLSRGYTVVDFVLDRARNRGTYVLTRAGA